MLAAALVCCTLLLSVLALSGGAPPAHAAALPAVTRPPGGNFANPAVRAVDIAEPAVVRIGTEEQATLTLQLCSRALTLPLAGGTYNVAGTGSGAFISSNGDILTADHVVHPPDDEVLYFAADDVANILDNLGQYDPGCGLSGGAVSASDVANGLIQLKFTTHVTNRRTVVWLSTAYSGPIDASSLKDAPTLNATVEAFSSFTQDDVAIVHVNLSDTPSIPVGRSEDVAVEDMLTVIGFPGNGDVTTSADNMLTPSVNGVTVSALKTNDNSSPLIQVAGNVEHGDSGAPLLNAQGQVVGVVSFGGADPQGSTSFMRATSSALPLIAGQHIDTAAGHFQVAWTQAFDEYAATYSGHWHVAQAEMGALATSYPQFKALALYLTYARAAAAQEQQSADTLPPTTVLVAGAGAIVVVLLLALLLILVVRARGKRRARQAATLTQAGYAQMYAPVVPQPYGPPSGPPSPPYPGSPYGPTYGVPQVPPRGPEGPMPVAARIGQYGADTPMRGSGTATSGGFMSPQGQGRPDSGWSYPSAPSGAPPTSPTRDPTPPPMPPSWSWGAPVPPPGADAYNSKGGVDSGGNSGY
jgi:S1-C subfamily serine protease